MAYLRSPRPIGDNAGTSINLIPPGRARRIRRRPRGALSGVLEELDAAFGTQFAAGAAQGAAAATQDASSSDVGAQALSELPPAATGTFSFKPIAGGICKPMDRATLDAVVDFQRQLNRVAQAKGFSKIAPDGDIGPGTLALFRQVQANSGSSVMGDASSCMGVGGDLARISQQVQAFADRLGVSSTVSSPSPAKTPSFVSPTTGAEVKVPNAGSATGSIIGAITSMPMPMKLALGGIAVGIGYFAFFEKRRKR